MSGHTMKIAIGGLLLLGTLWHVAQGDIQYHQRSPIYSERYDLCLRIDDEREAEALNIGQHWGTEKPTATTRIDLLKVSSPASSFDFRTWDPEGVIFFGDTLSGQDWFLLGLRKGQPEIQVRNSISQVSVSGGNRINDGQWHRISVKSEGDSIVLEVDHAEALRIWHITAPINESTDSTLRIAVGGMLNNQSNLLVPMNPAMDGCIRAWNWMNQTSAWLTSPAMDQGISKPCFEQVKRGSYFAGVGMAVFNSRDFVHKYDPKPENWALSLEMSIRPTKRTGFLFAVSATDGRPLLTLRMKAQIFILEVGSATVLRLPFPHRLCLASRLVLHISKTLLSWQIDEKKVVQPMAVQDYQALRAVWQDQHGKLFIGGMPNLLKLYPAEAMVFFQGCLQDLLVQGHTLDMDTAVFKCNSIWAHSCPSTDLFSQLLALDAKE
ncbi:sex hormone-binding globulin [Ambystoma mexicanum]|uniref:sex hormone-binding globulin n=1 Tax=Ambystoma mexicanum TaxID=8296 RepID=UPI0037E78A4E